MGRLSTSELAQVRDIASELEVLRFDQTSAIDAVLPEIRRFAQLESIVCMCPVERATGWDVERFHSDNLANPTRFRQLTLAFLRTAPRRFGWYDAARPEAAQRNVVVDLAKLIPRGELEQSRLYSELLVPAGLHRHHQVRALICDGSSLLAWFGGFHPESVTANQRDRLIALIPALRRRLSIERRLRAAPLLTAALEVALDQLGGAAFVINGEARIYEANQAGKTLLATRRAEVSAALRAALARQSCALAFELTPLAARGVPDHWLAVLSSPPQEARVAQAIARAVRSLKLTRRQAEVLALVVRGESNAAIATALGISDRGVELHISAMFVRASVDSRSALVSAVLLGRS